MRTSYVLGVGLVGVSVSGALAQDHNHITIDTDGSKIDLVTGYLPDESDYEIDADGWVRYQGDRLERASIAEWIGSPLEGWQLGSETVLTSDFFAVTGRLDGGDFQIEIAAFEYVGLGQDRASDFAWAERDGLDLVNVGQHSGATRAERSYPIGFNNHPHGQSWLAELPGRYQLTLVAWDANGVYDDSDPIHMYIRSVPAPGVAGGFAIWGFSAMVRRRR